MSGGRARPGACQAPGVIVVHAPYDVGTSARGGRGSARVGPGSAAIPSQEDPLSTPPASVTASVPEGKKLVIVESPAKSKSIAKYLNAVGSGWVVDSSVGQLVGAVAALLELDDVGRAGLLAALRELYEDGFLVEG